jgi:hypothetical protein
MRQRLDFRFFEAATGNPLNLGALGPGVFRAGLVRLEWSERDVGGSPVAWPSLQFTGPFADLRVDHMEFLPRVKRERLEAALTWARQASRQGRAARRRRGGSHGA